MSIELSEEHGLNPSLITCPICGKETAIALFGKLKGDVEAPKTVKGNELCDDCKKKYVTVIEMHKKGKKDVPTGRRTFVPKEAFTREFKDNIVLMHAGDFNKTFIK